MARRINSAVICLALVLALIAGYHRVRGSAPSGFGAVAVSGTSSPSALSPACAQSSSSFVMLPRSGVPLSQDSLAHRTVFTFIHVNKAGGTLIKEDVLKAAAVAHKWDGGGYGTVEAASLDAQCRHVVEGIGLACGRTVNLSKCGPVGGGHCPTRVIWGNLAVSQCNRTQPCVQAIVLREPVSRLISQYNYVCVDGREDRKKWLKEWKLADRCPLTLEEFLNTPSMTTPSLMVKRLVGTHGDPNSACALQVAKRNLFHPCMRYLVLDKFADGLHRLGKTWGTAMESFLAHASRMSKRNASPYPPRTIAQMQDEAMMKRVRQRLKNDIELCVFLFGLGGLPNAPGRYEYALQMYNEQWTSGVESCNEIN